MVSSEKKLLVINHCLDSEDPILSHQAATVMELSKHFPSVIVLTGRLGKFNCPTNVKIICTDWENSKRIRNVTKLLIYGLKTLTFSRPGVIFTHMADAQAAILAPFARVLRIRHVLWYAHAYKSRYLSFSSLFVDSIVSSTSGSMPIKSLKVRLIGQSIDTKLFTQNKFLANKVGRYLHVGRIDISKQIDLICKIYLNELKTFSTSDLTFIGSIGNPESIRYVEELKHLYRHEITNQKITFLAPVPRYSLPNVYAQYDVFIHAFSGSLDKTLLEATAVGLPVVTLNPEYLAEFGSWSKVQASSIGLEDELLAFLDKTDSEVTAEVMRRLNTVKERHSQDQWVSKLLKVLNGDILTTKN